MSKSNRKFGVLDVVVVIFESALFIVAGFAAYFLEQIGIGNFWLNMVGMYAVLFVLIYIGMRKHAEKD